MALPFPASTSFTLDNRRLAEAYDRLSDMQLESGKELVRLFGNLEGARILDVGCGTGRLARWMAADVVGPTGSVVGVDPLPERIAIAHARVSTIQFEVAQAEDLGAFPAESFDIVTMSSVFHWIDDKAKALSEIRRILRVGGRVGLTTMSKELSLAGMLSSVLDGVLERAPYAGRIGTADMSLIRPVQTTTDLISTILESQLQLEELRVRSRYWHRSNGEEMLDFLDSSSFGNFLRVVPEELRGGLRADVIEAFDALKGPDGIELRDWFTLLVAKRV